MKKWNSPAIEVLDINKTENGNKKAVIEFGKYNSDLTHELVENVVDFFEEIINPTPTGKGDNVTPNVEDKPSVDVDITDRIS